MNNQTTNGSKRIWAAVIDLIIFYVLMMVLTSFVIQPIVTSITDFNQRFEVYETTLVEKKLVNKTDNGLVLAISDFDLDKVDEYDQILIDLYSDESYITEGNNGLADYINSKKAATNVFAYVEATDTFKLVGDKKAAYSFYVTAYNNALSYLYQYDQAYNEAYSTCAFYQNLIKIIGIVVAGTLVYLVMPLIFKKGKTIGKKLFKLSLSNDPKEYKQIHFGQLLTRFLSIVFIEILGSQVFYYIPMIISLGTMMFTKKGFAIHDFIARTYIVDDIILAEEEKIKKDLELKDDIIEVEAEEKEENN